MKTSKEWLTVKEAARQLGGVNYRNIQTIYRLVYRRELESKKIR